uniref:2,3-bisphosphoglycerate-independent phosphoglycerate mutase n=1 Tax=Compsopogon caeruleus TaxID=31354 RepID=A0A1Z1XB89_9RHOD|nr:phosphoglycerate mutase [Compsopogon caeruleus]ARX96057.1 phosphoglycerate mutase [Compsopogon caeruleus]
MANAFTPVLDSLMSSYPMTLLHASGNHVGLPENQMGNSEVGHVTIGGGRIIPQDLVKISDSINNKSLFNNLRLTKLILNLETTNTDLHLIGLCSDGGVHSHINHLLDLINFLKDKSINNIYIHVITDGRDTNPYSGIDFIKQISVYIEKISNIRIATIMGRYYAMDRDSRWSRIEKAYNILINNHSISPLNPINFIQDQYNNSFSDEFIVPTRISKGNIKSHDSILFFNYRSDRMRQLLQALVKDDFKGFIRNKIVDLNILTFTKYDNSLSVYEIFEPNSVNNFLGEIISKNRLKQFRIAETEKYAHVTYFFNGGVEEPFRKIGEDRELVPSPKVSTYDLVPEMSADDLTSSVIKALDKKTYSLIIINYANPDMLGHTGNYNAAIKAMEIIDQSIGKLVDTIGKYKGLLIITADHGNVEYMIDANNKPHTSHTTNLVPFILIESEKNKISGHGGQVKLKSNGSLADIAPTILDIMGLKQPIEMTGKSLIHKPDYEIL